jgi:hypothetical protein
MLKINLTSKFIGLILLLGLLPGIGAGIILAGRQPVVEAQAPSNENNDEVTERPNQSQTIFYHRVSGFSFLPRDSDWDYYHNGNGCLYRPDDNTNVLHTFTYDLQLPHGAEITTFNVYFYDTSSFDLTVELWAFNGSGGATIIENSGSTAANGYGSVNSGVFSHTVDNINESLAFITTIGPNHNVTLQLCSIRLTYEFDISANYLPTMLNLASPEVFRAE